MNQTIIDLLIKSESAKEKIDIMLNYFLENPPTIDQIVIEEKELFRDLLEGDSSFENQKFMAEVCFFDQFAAISFEIFDTESEDWQVSKCFPGLTDTDLCEQGNFFMFMILDPDENKEKFDEIDEILFAKFGQDFLNHPEIKEIVESVSEKP